MKMEESLERLNWSFLNSVERLFGSFKRQGGSFDGLEKLLERLKA